MLLLPVPGAAQPASPAAQLLSEPWVVRQRFVTVDLETLSLTRADLSPAAAIAAAGGRSVSSDPSNSATCPSPNTARSAVGGSFLSL